jgi:sulfur-oxidizing protein SoxX
MDGHRASSWRTWVMAISIAVLGACSDKSKPVRQIPGADPKRGLELIEHVGCGACHVIPGLAWPQGAVGGSLEGFAERPLIAGRLPNQPATLVAWLRDPPSLSPETAMPPTPLSEAQARDVAAYLYSLDDR